MDAMNLCEMGIKDLFYTIWGVIPSSEFWTGQRING